MVDQDVRRPAVLPGSAMRIVLATILTALLVSAVDTRVAGWPERAPVRHAAPSDAAVAALAAPEAFTADGDGWVARGGASMVRATAHDVRLTPVGPTGVPVHEAPATLETVSVRRSAELLQGSTAVGHVEPDGRLSLHRGEVVEELRTTAQGIEQSWRFAARPEGSGDLVVRVRVAGQTFAGETPRGVRFAEPTGRFGLQYGHGVWIDAQGRRTPVQARYREGEIDLRVAAAVVEASAYPSILDPPIQIGPESNVSTTVSFGEPQFSSYDESAVAFGQTSYLAVWSDGSTVRGSRVESSGAIIDDRGSFTIWQPKDWLDFSSPRRVVVVAGSNDYLVAWIQDGWSQEPTSIRAAIVSQFDEDPCPVMTGEPLNVQTIGFLPYTWPEVAFDPLTEKYLVLWREGSKMKGKWVTAEGVEPDPLILGSDYVASISVACRDNGCFAVWTDGSDNHALYGAIVSDSGPAEEVSIAIATPPGAVKIVPGNTGYVVVWLSPSISGMAADIYAARLSEDGTMLDQVAPTLLLSGEELSSYQIVPTVDQQHIVLLNEVFPERVTALLVDTAGPPQALFPPKTLLQLPDGSYSQARMACTGESSSCMLVSPYPYEEQGVSGSSIVAIPVDPELQQSAFPPLQPTLSRRVSPQSDPAVAHRKGSKGHVVLWREPPSEFSPPGTAWIRGALATPDPLGDVTVSDIPEPISVSETATPTVACGQTASTGQDSCLVAWVEAEGALAVALVDELGISAPSYVTSVAIGRPAVAFGGSHFLVVWSQGFPNPAVLAARVSLDGDVLAADIQGIVLAENGTGPAVVHADQGYWVVWRDGVGTVRGLERGAGPKDTEPAVIEPAARVRRSDRPDRVPHRLVDG